MSSEIECACSCACAGADCGPAGIVPALDGGGSALALALQRFLIGPGVTPEIRTQRIRELFQILEPFPPVRAAFLASREGHPWLPLDLR